MTLDKMTMRRLWSETCRVQLGVDEDGNEIDRLSPIGAVAASMGVPVSEMYCNPEQQAAAAEFLHEWARAVSPD